jgi:hypothetical protein
VLWRSSMKNRSTGLWGFLGIPAGDL